MASTLAQTEWKAQETAGKHSQGELAILGLVGGANEAPAHFIAKCSDTGAIRYAAQVSGFDDYEIADDLHISHGYMSKVLKGTAGLSGRRLVLFMRKTGCIAPLQWLADQMGCDVVARDPAAARIKALEAELNQLKGRR